MKDQIANKKNPIFVCILIYNWRPIQACNFKICCYIDSQSFLFCFFWNCWCGRTFVSKSATQLNDVRVKMNTHKKKDAETTGGNKRHMNCSKAQCVNGDKIKASEK